MMAMGILPLPGTEKAVVKNRFNFEMDLSWVPIVTTCMSIIGVLFGAVWIVEPVVKETNWIIGKLTFIPIFFYRMLVWLLILIILHSFSIIALVCFAALNWITLIFVQDQLEIEPVNHSLLSLIFPVYKLPSYKVSSRLLMKILFWMVLTGNPMLLVFHGTVYCLYHFNVYNPWSNGHYKELWIQEEMYQNINPVLAALFFAATLPILLSHFLRVQR
jgi:hypothetical protein